MRANAQYCAQPRSNALKAKDSTIKHPKTEFNLHKVALLTTFLLPACTIASAFPVTKTSISGKFFPTAFLSTLSTIPNCRFVISPKYIDGDTSLLS